MSSFYIFRGAKLHIFTLSTKKSYTFFIYCGIFLQFHSKSRGFF